jgi:hypothetical protein
MENKTIKKKEREREWKFVKEPRNAFLGRRRRRRRRE